MSLIIDYFLAHPYDYLVIAFCFGAAGWATAIALDNATKWYIDFAMSVLFGIFWPFTIPMIFIIGGTK